MVVWVVVRGREMESNQVHYSSDCWNEQTHQRDKDCWRCEINNQSVSAAGEVLTISGNDDNGSQVNVEVVYFIDGNITKMPKLIDKHTNQRIVEVVLFKTNTKVLNEQFFGDACEELTSFLSYCNDGLSVSSSPFKECTSLKHLGLISSNISSISPDAFIGLHQLIVLNLLANHLDEIQPGWFNDLINLEILYLNGNQTHEVPHESFSNLTKLKLLDLSGNIIEVIRRKMLENNEQLTSLNLLDNQIKSIQVGTFTHLTKLTRLDLEYNNCTHLDFINETTDAIDKALTECLPTTCLIPTITNGHIISLEDNSMQTPGDNVDDFEFVKVVCEPSYFVFHEKENQRHNRCLGIAWQYQKWPECHSE